MVFLTAVIAVHMALALAGVIARCVVARRERREADIHELAFICLFPALFWALVYVAYRHPKGWL